MGGDAVAHFAAVVAPGGLLDLVQDEVGRVVDAGEDPLGPRVVVVVPLQHLALRKIDCVQFPDLSFCEIPAPPIKIKCRARHNPV